MGTDEQQQVEQQAATTEAYVQFLEGWRADHDEHQHPASAPAYFSGWNAGAAWQAARYAPLVEAARVLAESWETDAPALGIPAIHEIGAALAELGEQGHDGE